MRLFRALFFSAGLTTDENEEAGYPVEQLCMEQGCVAKGKVVADAGCELVAEVVFAGSGQSSSNATDLPGGGGASVLGSACRSSMRAASTGKVVTEDGVAGGELMAECVLTNDEQSYSEAVDLQGGGVAAVLGSGDRSSMRASSTFKVQPELAEILNLARFDFAEIVDGVENGHGPEARATDSADSSRPRVSPCGDVRGAGAPSDRKEEGTAPDPGQVDEAEDEEDDEEVKIVGKESEDAEEGHTLTGDEVEEAIEEGKYWRHILPKTQAAFDRLENIGARASIFLHGHVVRATLKHL